MRLAIAIFVFAFSGIVNAATGSPGLSWKVQYDNDGRVVRSVDPAGRPTLYAYSPATGDPLQSVTQTPPEGAPVTWRFDADGRPTAMADGVGNVTYAYDAKGQLTSVARAGAPEIHYTYDPEGRLATMRVGTFYRMAYTYDYLGRLAKVETPAGPITYDYQTGLNTVVRALPNGVKTFWKRSSNGQLEQITHGFFANRNSKKYAVLAEYTYEHGADGRISAIRENSAGAEARKTFAYDTMGRLVHATGAEGQQYSYTYDDVGNRTKATATGRPDQNCTYDWAGRLTSVDGKACSYDACGNLTNVTLDGVERQYRYQFDGRLAEARAGTETAQYRYDGYGRLVSRKAAAGETTFIPDPLSPYWQPLVMEEPGGKRTLVVWDGAVPLALVRKGAVEWLLGDHLGSVRVVADGKGKVKDEVHYDPFGQVEGGERSSLRSLGFVGFPVDVLANSYSSLARAYAPALGQFLQPDPSRRIPSGSGDSCSLYSYCDGDPVNFLDLNGAERTASELRAEFRELQFSIMQRQFEMRQHQREMFERIRQQQTEMRQQQRDMYDRLRQQSQGVGERQLAAAIKERDDFLISYPMAVAATAINLARLCAAPLDNVGVNMLSEVGGGIAEGMSASMPYKGAMDPMNNSVDNVSNVIGAARDLFSASSYAFDMGQIIRGATRERVLVGRKLYLTNDVREYELERIGNGSQIQPRFDIFRDEYMTRTNFHIDELSSRTREYLVEQAQGYVEDRAGTVARSFTRDMFVASGRPSGPSPVGGVYLGGAGTAVEGLGALQGVRLDENNNLVLIGENGSDIRMPPLRIDDVVTIFRSVYLYGEGPTVTIDPNPKDPENSAMIIRHGKATENTYVGWILYEADRLMKGYTLGVDNISQKDMVSRVPGYQDVQNTMYFGGTDPRESQKEGNWERFWIVPAAAQRFEGSRKELTLFDVPLKVKTQKMKWEGSALVDDLAGKSSPGATAFTDWFTKNYDGIAGEQYLTPPKETGITTPVPVFTELRRIALLTAIAEKLRDQGVTMPFWMRDYEVRAVPFEQYTPAMEVTRTKEDGSMVHTARIFGGVELTPETKAVHTYATVADAAKAPPEIRTEVDRSVKLAARLETAVAATSSRVDEAPLTVRRVQDTGKTYQTVSMPGAETKALGPCRMDEVDVAVPFGNGHDIRLVRSFNSFFNAKGPWGSGWALDLPRLDEIQVPGKREGSSVSYTTAYELVTPLNSVYARFSDVRPVPELKNTKLQVPDQDGTFYGLADDAPDFLKGSATRVALLKNGQEWHFSPHGDLVAIKDGGEVTGYERDGHGRVTRIVGLWGGALAAEIAITYDAQGNLLKAVGKSLEDRQAKPVEVGYAYAPTGRLAGVGSADGTVGYEYRGPLVASVTWKDPAPKAASVTMRSFEYNTQGQLTSENQGRTVLRHTITPVASGVEASVAGPDGRSSTRYDQQMRPVEAQDPDGSRTAWAYQPNGDVETTVTAPGRHKVAVLESADGRKRVVREEGSPEVAARFDDGGRLVSVAEGPRVLLTQSWRPDGQLAAAETGSQKVSLEYGERDLLSSVVVQPASPPKKEKLSWTETVHQFFFPTPPSKAATEWQETVVDSHGSPTEIKDSKGLQMKMSYDATGKLTSAIQVTPEGNSGYNVVRDAQGRVRTVNSSWGDTSYGYDGDGGLGAVVATVGGDTASVVVKDGLVRQVRGFDRGVTTFSYVNTGTIAGALAGVTCANGLKLAHQYDQNGLLESVVVGNRRRVRLGHDQKGRVVEYAVESVAP
jgi:RHS repeat-associated protein